MIGDNGKDIMIITNEGIIIRIDINQVSTMSRVTQGVRLINLKNEQVVSSVAVIDNIEEFDEDADEKAISE